MSKLLTAIIACGFICAAAIPAFSQVGSRGAECVKNCQQKCATQPGPAKCNSICTSPVTAKAADRGQSASAA
jgi:hypothetical protein